MSRSEAGKSIEEAVGDASNVLVLAPSMDPADDEACGRLLSMGPEADVLCVTLAGSPDDRLGTWRANGVEPDGKRGFVAVGDTARSAVAGSIGVPGKPIAVETLSSPADLTGLGIEISGFLSEWDGPIVVCFHTLTALLQYVDVERAFRFLHVLTGRFEAVDARAHFHMDPSAHEEREINTLKSLFDAVVEFEDGEWTVRTR